MNRIPADITVYAVDLTVYIAGTGLVTKYFATHGGYFDSGSGINFYEPRLKQPGNFQQTIFADGTTGGSSEVGYGEIVLLNGDGGLDPFINYGFDGRSVVLRKIIAGVATILMSCSMEQPTPTWDTVPIRIKDKQQLFNVAIQPNKYAGDNVLPAGVEGTNDIKSKPKPLLYGQVFNATPVCVNTSRLIYQGHESALQDISAVYDKGVSLVRGTDYSSAADIQANNPAPGTYRAYLAGGMFRLGSSPAGQITFDGIEGATAADRTAAQIAKRIALRAITSGEIDSGDVTALDTANNSVIGIYINNETTIRAALDEVLNSVGAWYGFDSVGVLNMGQFVAPTGTAIATLTAGEILEIERQPTNDTGRGVPPYKVNLGYAKNNTVQDAASLAGRLSSLSPCLAGNFPSALGPVSIAYGNGVFVAIPQATGTAYATSLDGITWTSRSLPSSAAWEAIAYGNGVFAVVSSGSTSALSSADGITWSARTLPAGNFRRANCITYGNGLFVVVDANSTAAATSPDGITWTARTLPSNSVWASVAYGNGLFIAVSTSTAAASSTDGITWTARTVPAGSWDSATYGNGIFVIIDSTTDGIYATSPDGITWTQRTLPSTQSIAWWGVTYGDGFFMTVGVGVFAVSGDGLAWSVGQLPVGGNWGGITYGSGVFVTANNSDDTAIFRLSSDFIHHQFVSKEYRTVSDSDSAVLTKHPTAGELNFNTLLVDPTEASTEVTRVLNLRKVDRDFLSVKVASTILPADLLGKVITIQMPRYGYDAGKKFIITGVVYDYELEITTLKVWG